MSNALAIASVTKVLQDLLHNGLVDSDVTGMVGGNVTVSALPPDRILGNNGAAEATQLNLFLHQVTPNSGWRNSDLPTRDGRGDRIANPLLALDLHYLLSAYGAEELHSEILIGHAMQLLHEHPVLDRDLIRDTLAGGGGMLPPVAQALTASDLADQIELIKITPDSMSVDDLSKLWTALQSHYRTTAAYAATVVLIDRRQARRAGLPVLTRGRGDPITGRDQGVRVQPSLLAPFPTLEAIVPPDQQIAIRMGELLTVTGHHLQGDQVAFRFTEPRSRATLLLPATGVTPGRVQVQLPPDPPPGPVAPGSPEDPASWQPGAYLLAAVVRQPDGSEATSNELPVMLAPRVPAIAATLAAGIATFDVSVSPPVRDSQRISLIVGERELPSAPLAAGSASALQFTGTGFSSGTSYVFRLRVDGVDSLLIDRAARPSAYDPTQRVTIP